MNIPYIQQYLSRSYWAEGIPVETVKRAIEGSLCFGVYHHDVQVGFARVVTDAATFAYLADVFIDEKHRSKGLSKWLMQVIMDHESLQGLRRFMLATRDAHGLYKQFGFAQLTNPERLMQIVVPDIYKKGKK
jgi:GNAT superfamily N-acetyltransferase